MKTRSAFRAAAMAVCGVGIGLIASRLMAVPHGRQEAGENAPVALSISAQPPKGAVLLFTGKPEQMSENFVQRYTNNPPKWMVDKEGVAYPVATAKMDITSKQEFGDCYVHAEFRGMLDDSGKPIGHGNSGVGLQGRYEIQILNSYGDKPEAHGAGALYSEKAALVNASKKPGEWQTFDIIFRAPRFDANGMVTEKPRATVFQNGIIVQNNEEFTGMTGIQYGQYKEMTKTGPIILQGDHDPVQFRNVWVAPIQ